ncbi:MAG: protoheme IX farnesyltransferase [Deltaproteobacteria bacterium]|nr:protoheme IX farnesyltransferase [Deltaproteobacteria bacterium]MBI5810096.1 protoheme IX farnesyltransferase [Deltaproteobacteria bacterium]
MIQAIRNYTPLFKIRICSLITFSAVVGLISASSSGFRVTFGNTFLLIAVTMMASAGASAFNHYFDRDIDTVMDRTKARPLAAGRVEDPKKILFAATLLFAASILISFKALNYMVGLHLFLGGFVYAVVYTVWLKRRSRLNIIAGGLAGSFAVLAGGASATPELCMLPVLLSIVMFFWTPSHFWSFAILKREEYAAAGIPMLPNVIGDIRTSRYILANTVLLAGASLTPVFFGFLGYIYGTAAFVLGAFFILRNIQLLKDASKHNARKNFRASMIYLGVLFLAVIADLLVR